MSRKKPDFVVRSTKQGLNLIRHPAIAKNFAKALRWRPRNELAVLVPCAGTKPFPEAPSHKQGYLAALEGKDADLWVVSEPLGVVPYEWSRDFPNANYDFPPRYLKGEAWDALVERVAEWLEKVALKYERVFVALPGHHERLLRAALELHNPGNLRDATHSQCISSKACPPGHGRATSKKYRRYLGAVVKNPDAEDIRTICAGCGKHIRGRVDAPIISHGACSTACWMRAAEEKEAKEADRLAKNGDESLLALERRLEAGDLTAVPEFIVELRRAGREAPWDALVIWRGPLTGTGDEGLLRVGQTAEGIAVIEPRPNKAGWGDPRVGVYLPVTGPRGPGWAPAWHNITGAPQWVLDLAAAPRLIQKSKRRNADDRLRDLERRWRSTHSPADLEAWHVARHRAGQTPENEVFYREIARRAGRFMASAANRLDRAAAHVRTQAFNAADVIERQCLAFAAASKSAAARLSRSKPPNVSGHVRDQSTRSDAREYWEDLMADASEDVGAAEGLLRDMAFDMERNGDKVGAERVFAAVRWLVDLRSAISHARNANGGHDGRSWWERHGPMQGLAVDRWWRLRGQPIPSLTEDVRRNPDEDLRALRRRYDASGDPSDLKCLYANAERAGQHLRPEEEFEAVELMVDGEELSAEDAVRRHEQRVRDGRLTRREAWLLKKFAGRLELNDGMALADIYHGLTNSLEGDPDASLKVMRIARLMRRIELGDNAVDRMEEIATILGADRGVDAFDDPRDGSPLYVYAAWEDFGRPTLSWRFGGSGADGSGFMVRPTTEMVMAVDRLADSP